MGTSSSRRSRGRSSCGEAGSDVIVVPLRLEGRPFCDGGHAAAILDRQVVMAHAPRHDERMRTPQGGILALGTASHAYLEFEVSDPQKRLDLVTAISSMR